MEIIIILVLILLNGLFSMSEIALVSARKFKLESLIKKGSRNAKLALELSNNPNKFLSTVQMGITLIGILTGIFGGKEITEQLAKILHEIPLLEKYSHGIAVLTIIFIITFLSIVFGELIPKRIGLLFPETIAVLFARPMQLVSLLTKPFVALLTGTNDIIMKIFGIRDDIENKVTEEEIKSIVESSAMGGEIQEIEQVIVERVFALGDRKISEIMTHRTDIKYISFDDNLQRIREIVSEEPHSIYPVIGDALDDIKGIINIKELFLLNGEFQIEKYLTDPLYVHDNAPVYYVLEKFRESKSHLAIIVDEYGGIQGVVTVDDVLDALVGDMSKNQDEEYTIQPRDESSWFADAQYPYYELLHYFDIPNDENSGEYNTIAGLILNVMGHIPKIGDKIDWNNFTIEIIDMDGVRIDKLLISKK